MSRRSSTPSVTLFPFLAVLVCAMGALILLLLVTTRRIRLQTEAERGLTHQHVAAADAAESARRQAQAAESAARQAALMSQMAAQQRQALAEHEAEKQAKHQQWQVKLAAMNDRNGQLLHQAALLRQQIAEEEAAAATNEDQRQKLAALIADAENRNSSRRKTETELQQQALALLQQRKELQDQIDVKKVAQAIRKPVFEIVAHDGNSGTDRRPILIECRSDGVMFASEQVQISARDLNDFNPARNPLLAGAEALTTYWSLADAQQGHPESKPYVLLIVRPSGTVGFYVARRYLEKLNQDFGYELVPEGAEIKWPVADPQAVEVCRTAVERALQETRQIATRNSGLGGGDGSGVGSRGRPGSGVRPGGKGNSEQIVGANGEFELPEVEQLKNTSPRDSIDMLGPEWSPQRQSLGSNRPGTAGQGITPREMDHQTASGARGMPGAELVPPAVDAANREDVTTSNASADGATGSGLNAQRSSVSGTSRGTGTLAEPGVENRASGPSGQPGTPRSKLTPYGQPPEMPANPLAERQEGMPKDGGTDRQWGHSRNSGAIGIEREVILQLYADKITIVDGPSAELPPELGRGEFHETVAAMIQAQALTWGEPPAKFVWRPRLRIEIHPGGNQHYARLKELINHWGMSSKVEYKLD